MKVSGFNSSCVVNPCLTNGTVKGEPVNHTKECHHGVCSSTEGGRCDCDDHYEGPACTQCTPGWRLDNETRTCVVDDCWDHSRSAIKYCGQTLRHGHCNIMDGSCVCSTGWSVASNCTACDTSAYYPVNGTCQTDHCKPNPCNGHDEDCDKATGKCHCMPAYIDPASGGHMKQCSACHSGFTRNKTGGPTSPCTWDSCANIDCHYHGTCEAEAGQKTPRGSCACETNWDPLTNCRSCKAGYILNAGGDNCVVDKCNPDGIPKCKPPGSQRCDIDGTCVCTYGSPLR
jgi:hypothetical protein